MSESPRILVVDDVPHRLRSLLDITTSAGHEVVGATSGDEALGLAAEYRPDLLLLSDSLPGAVNICREIKAHASAAGIALVLLSHDPGLADRRIAALEAGADSCIELPLSQVELLARVQAVLRLAQANKALRASEARFRAQYKGLPVPVYSWRRSDGDFVLTDYNHAAAEITGGHVADLLGCTASELYSDAPQILEELALCYRERRSFQREMLYQLRSTGEAE